MAHITWTRSEIDLLIENFDLTTEELMELLPGRNKKSINRQLEKLREEGLVGLRSKRTRKRAYRQRKPSTGLGMGCVEEYEPVGGEYDNIYEPINEDDD